MSAFKGTVYWRDQCSFCKSFRCCKYHYATELLMARLTVVELESKDCYGSLTFWCDFYQEDPEIIEAVAKKHGEVVDE